MQGERTRLLQLKLVLTDAAATTLAFLLAYWLRDFLLAGYFGQIYPLKTYLWIYVLAVLSLPIILIVMGLYEIDGITETRASFGRKAARLFQSMVLEFLLLSAMGFSLKLHYVSRLLTVLFVVQCYVLFLLARTFLWPLFLRDAERKALGVLIVGTGESARALATLLSERPRIGTRLLGFIRENGPAPLQLAGHPVLGTVQEAESVLSSHVIDEVLIAVPQKSLNELEPFLLLCEQQGITARLACDFLPRGSARLYLEHLDGVPLLTFTTTPNNPNLLALKRVVDVAVGSMLLVLSSPLFIVVPILIKLTSKGPVLYKQIRCGLNGRRFTFLKFRSMVEGADEMRKDIEHLNEAMRPVFKIASDPRVTTLGRFLRRASIDELPQLFNVIRGEMSLVGPRPPLPEEVQWYKTWQRRRLSMKPGLTCLWQVSGRSELSFNDWVDMDLQYIDNWSPWLDLKILLKTVPAVVLRKGAW
jgi:exopolysaccharide biosynthesis polyprenyl glycosylphosphotransferase